MQTFSFPYEFVKQLVAWNLEVSEDNQAPHITRVAMYKALDGKLARYDAGTTKTLAISRSAPLCRRLGLVSTQVVDADYPEHSITNLHAFADESFDFCVSDQVLEHVEGDPFQAMRECVRVLRPGGWMCHTTCFINPIHAHPGDFWRFTPDALRLLASASGCIEIEASGWGNREAWALIEAGFRRARLPSNPEHPLHKLALHNNKRWPIVVWMTAQKPAGSKAMAASSESPPP